MIHTKISQSVSFVLILCCSLSGFAQETISFQDMSFWKNTQKTNWQLAGDATADLVVSESMTALAGKGVLINLPNKENRANLISNFEHGDADISFDFMMAKHSNSGFYLQGRYEVQLLDKDEFERRRILINRQFDETVTLLDKESEAYQNAVLIRNAALEEVNTLEENRAKERQNNILKIIEDTKIKEDEAALQRISRLEAEAIGE
jgi:hypothetical protein